MNILGSTLFHRKQSLDSVGAFGILELYRRECGQKHVDNTLRLSVNPFALYRMGFCGVNLALTYTRLVVRTLIMRRNHVMKKLINDPLEVSGGYNSRNSEGLSTTL